MPDLDGAYHEVPFSYRGLASNGDPLPYKAEDTYEELHDVARTLEVQVSALAARLGAQIDIVSSSEGALATQIYLATHPHAPVRRVVMASPVIASALVYFPPPGRSGWGMVSGLGLRQWIRLFELFGWSRPDRLPVMRSILEHGPIMSRIERCPMGGMPETVLMPLYSTITMPFDASTDLSTYLVGVQHASVLHDRAGKAAAQAVLAGKTPSVPAWHTVASWIGRALGTAWRMPPLAATLPESWRPFLAKAPSLDCPAVERLARRTFEPLVRASSEIGRP